MREIVFDKEIVRKNYSDFDITIKEFESMKYIYDLYNTLKYKQYTYRALNIFELRSNGYTMEFIKGLTLSEAIFHKKNHKSIMHASVWLANYMNQFENNKIGYLSDYTTHNIMISRNNEVILIDQASAKEKSTSVERIISYFIARLDFEKSLHISFSKKYIIEMIDTYNELARVNLNIEILKKELIDSYKRLYRKIVIGKFNILKRIVFKIILNISQKCVLFKINTFN